MLEPMVRCADVRAECLPATLASVSTAFPLVGVVEAVTNDTSGTRQQAQRVVWTADGLHYDWTLSMLEQIVSI
jgi:hypothetical protein